MAVDAATVQSTPDAESIVKLETALPLATSEAWTTGVLHQPMKCGIVKQRACADHQGSSQ